MKSENILVLDTENTTWNKGSPFDRRNFNVCISFKNADEAGVVFGEISKIQNLISSADRLVFFNAKYDLQWLWKLDIDTGDKRIWCCQVFEFLHSRQSRPYPSLEDTAQGYGFGQKLDTVKIEYWDKGINTHEIPKPVLSEYALQDTELTWKIYYKQQKIQKPHQKTLFSLEMQDLVALAEMERNGLKYNINKSLEKAGELETEILKVQSGLSIHHSVPNFNWASNDHLSSLLYGGEIKQIVKKPNGAYKSGNKIGQVKYSNEEKIYNLPRKYKPIKGSSLTKENKWSVEESYLRRLKGDETLISGIIRIKELEKLKNTYLEGIPKKHTEKNWEPDILHGQFNQVRAATGRLSSTDPNLQNIPEPVLELFETRYGKPI